MITQEIVNALREAGYTNGWIVNGDEITLWQDEPIESTPPKLGLPDQQNTSSSQIAAPTDPE